MSLARAELPDAVPAIAIFDLDGTLTRGDSFLAFLLYVLRRKPRRLSRCLGLPFHVARFALGRVSRDALKEAFLRAALKGARRGEIERHAAAFAEICVRRMIKPAALRRIEWHRARGDYLILASASVDLYVPLIAAKLGFAETVCTQTAWHDGRLTGALAGPNLRGVEKLRAVQEIVARQPGKPEVFAYSDSAADLPLLAFADRGIAVDPDKTLRMQASRSGLVTEDWRGLSQPA